MKQEPADRTYRLEIIGEMDRHTAEALRLEIHRLAKRFGIEVSAFRVEAPLSG